MVDPKRILKSLSKAKAARNPSGADPKAVLFKMRKAAQLREAAVDGTVVADPPFERVRQV